MLLWTKSDELLDGVISHDCPQLSLPTQPLPHWVLTCRSGRAMMNETNREKVPGPLAVNILLPCFRKLQRFLDTAPLQPPSEMGHERKCEGSLSRRLAVWQLVSLKGSGACRLQPEASGRRRWASRPSVAGMELLAWFLLRLPTREGRGALPPRFLTRAASDSCEPEAADRLRSRVSDHISLWLSCRGKDAKCKTLSEPSLCAHTGASIMSV